MRIVFYPNVSSGVRVQRAGVYIALCLVDQHCNTYDFLFDEDTAEYLIEKFFHYVYEERVPDDWGDDELGGDVLPEWPVRMDNGSF